MTRPSFLRGLGRALDRFLDRPPAFGALPPVDGALLRVSEPILERLERGDGRLVVLGVRHLDDGMIDLTVQNPPPRTGADLRIAAFEAAVEALLDSAASESARLQSEGLSSLHLSAVGTPEFRRLAAVLGDEAPR